MRTLITSGTLTSATIDAARQLLDLHDTKLFAGLSDGGNLRYTACLRTGDDTFDYEPIVVALERNEKSIVFAKSLDQLSLLAEFLHGNE